MENLWKCTQCGLNNYPSTNQCIACFTINDTIIPIQNNQTVTKKSKKDRKRRGDGVTYDPDNDGLKDDGYWLHYSTKNSKVYDDITSIIFYSINRDETTDTFPIDLCEIISSYLKSKYLSIKNVSIKIKNTYNLRELYTNNNLKGLTFELNISFPNENKIPISRESPIIFGIRRDRHSNTCISLHICKNLSTIITWNNRRNTSIRKQVGTFNGFNYDKFHHLAFVYDFANNFELIYIDGIQVHKTNNSICFVNLNEPIRLLGYDKINNGSEQIEMANIYDIRIWKCARNKDEIINNMNKDLIGDEKDLIGNWLTQKSESFKSITDDENHIEFIDIGENNQCEWKCIENMI